MPNFVEIYRLDDVVIVEMDEQDRLGLKALISQYPEFLDPDMAESRRLFPVAYPDDPELDSGFQALAQGELIDSKQANLNTMAETIMLEELTAEQAEAWMIVLNDLRLVLGTQMDVSEDDPLDDLTDGRTELYHSLSLLVSLLVEALS